MAWNMTIYIFTILKRIYLLTCHDGLHETCEKNINSFNFPFYFWISFFMLSKISLKAFCLVYQTNITLFDKWWFCIVTFSLSYLSNMCSLLTYTIAWHKNIFVLTKIFFVFFVLSDIWLVLTSNIFDESGFFFCQ